MSQVMNARRCASSNLLSSAIPSQKKRKIDGSSRGRTSEWPSEHILEAISRPLPTRGSSSGESAGRWFDDVNKNVAHDARRAVPDDQEPPFYIGSQEPYRPLPYSAASSRAFGGAVAGMVTDSEKEDLRDVIDDLTIENKKLKRKLRSHKSQKSRASRAPSHRAGDKLFELRVHGMRADKKRELELLLKNFASSLSQDTTASRSTASRSSDQLASTSGVSITAPGAQNANVIHTDSGYGSNSNSGKGQHPVPPVSKDHSIKTYLHDVPDVLLPRESHRMSDKAKMALVVRRLEQLFTGKQASLGDHDQPMQQQEVSQSAAQAERLEEISRNQKSRREGSREAHILPPDSNISLDVTGAPSPAKCLHSKLNGEVLTSSPAPGSGSGPSRSGSPDQRPTRPLDLDIGRAQVAKDNIEYIRHLGLSAPGFDKRGSKKDQWIYLNLLVSMAQLHNLNVTPDFIRQAIKKHSTKFELSKDLRSVRWKGGVDTTMFSKETEQAMEYPTAHLADPVHGESVRSRTVETDGGSNRPVSFTPSDDQTSREESSNAVNPNYSTLATSPSFKQQVSTYERTPLTFDYKPMFYQHKASLRREAASSDGSNSSAATDSGGLVDQMSRSDLSVQSPEKEGMLTFFNNPFFCSDFSADKHPVKHPRNALSGLADYSRGVLGTTAPLEDEENPLREHDACYFAPQFAAKFTEPKNKRLLEFEPEPIEAAGEDETQPMEMEASGLGMTVPADNFAIDVKVAMERGAGRHVVKRNSRLQKTTPALFDYLVQSAEHIELQPSRLPPPLYFSLPSSSSSNLDPMDEDSDSSDFSSSLDEISPVPPALMRHNYTESSGNVASVEDIDEDDTSVDLLEAARAENPELLAAQEREYILNHPGAAMQVSTSLAATVGTPSVQENHGGNSAHEVRSDIEEMGSEDDNDDDDDDE